MSVNEAILQREAQSPAARSIGKAISVVALMIVVVAAAAVVALLPSRQAVEPAGVGNSPEAVLEDLVNRGLVPSQALESAPEADDAIMEDLVKRGLIPSQAYGGSEEQILRNLVNRGLIPSQALDN